MDINTNIWMQVKAVLRTKLTSVSINTWFNDTELLSIAGNRAVIYSPVDYKRATIEAKYTDKIRDSFNELFAEEFEVVIVGQKDDPGSPARETGQKNTLLNDFTFENYIVGNSNSIAHAAAASVADMPASAYNPLFIYGDSGLGKTHLLCAISNAVKKKYPHFKIIYMKGDEFTNELVSAIRSGKNAEFREKYRRVDLFLMDDIQFIAGKDATQEEFFHTFNSLYESNKQIVLTSDRPPNDMARLENRLRTRFEGGLIVQINPPDYEMRAAIIKKKSEILGLFLTEKQINYISENITNNVRQLEGTIKKIYAYTQLGDKDMASDAIVRAVDEMKNDKGEEIPSPKLILDEICRYYNISEADLKGQRKTAELALARQISMYLMRTLSDCYTYGDIGKYLGRDHSTIIHGVSKIEERLSDPSFKTIIDEITENIKARL